MNKYNLRDYAYTAGCIDCDGWITIKKDKYGNKDKDRPRYRLTVGLNGKDGRVQQFLCGRWGGRITRRDASANDIKRGINGTYVYQWEISEKQAAELLRKCLIFFKYKKEQAEIALRLRTTVKQHGDKLSPREIQKREEIYLKLREAKQKFVIPVQAQRTSAITLSNESDAMFQTSGE
jgi:hypothetical protein